MNAGEGLRLCQIHCVCGGGVGILGGSIASVGGGAIAGGRGGVSSSGGGSSGAVVSVVVTSAIGKDGSEEGEGGDVSNHGDLGLLCVNVFLFLRLGLNYTLVRTLP